MPQSSPIPESYLAAVQAAAADMADVYARHKPSVAIAALLGMTGAMLQDITDQNTVSAPTNVLELIALAKDVLEDIFRTVAARES